VDDLLVDSKDTADEEDKADPPKVVPPVETKRVFDFRSGVLPPGTQMAWDSWRGWWIVLMIHFYFFSFSISTTRSYRCRRIPI